MSQGSKISQGKIVLTFNDENITIEIDKTIKIKDAAIACGRALGMMVKGYDEDILIKTVETFAQALEEKYLSGIDR